MSEDVIEKLLFLSIGWLLGLLGPVIVDAIRRRRENALGRLAIHAELRDVSHKLALAAQYLYLRKGIADRGHLEWVKRHLEGYPSLSDTGSIMQSVRLQLSWSDDELQAYARTTSNQPGKGITLQKYAVPLLDSRVAALWSFSTTLQRHFLQIRTDIDLLNDIVDRSRHFSDKTFSKLEGNNYQLVIENIEQCNDLYFERSKRVVDQVHNLSTLP
jgi:hypothetical protein